jgi:serine/threonine-protein kinase PknG
MQCTRTAGCHGSYADDGYCTECGAPAPTRVDPPASLPAAATTGMRGSGTRSRATELVALPPYRSPDPLASVSRDVVVAEEHRYCASSACGAPVGRTRDGLPGRTEGFCPACGQPFSFAPRLRAGDLVGGQYDIVGCLAHGGLGWIYLARDRNVENVWRVLKGLLRDDDADAIANALDERRFLAAVDHPNIVKIINFVEHQGAGYIVMEYVDGVTVRQVLRDRRAANGGRASPLPATHAISYVLEMLRAVDYLHDRGLLYCDFKPENVMLTATTVKLIDLGGVYRMDDASSPVYGTVGFQAPEIAETGPTVASDLYAVARTLAVLCSEFRGFQSTYRFTVPPPDDVPQLAAHDSLYQLVRRATSLDPSARFSSGGEMADQLKGVLREIVAAETGRPALGVSSHFTSQLRGRLDVPDAHMLPVPLVDVDDPAAGYLATIASLEPAARIDALRRAPQPTTGVGLQLTRALLDVGRPGEAATVLSVLDTMAPGDWRVRWYRAVHSLVAGAPVSAVELFAGIHAHLPGELAPKLGTAMALESVQNVLGAAQWYDIVSRTDPSYTMASFGLARCRLVAGDRSGAIDAYDRVADASSAFVDAQVAKVGALLADDNAWEPVAESARIVERLPLGSPSRSELAPQVLEAARAFVIAHPSGVPPATLLLGCACTEVGLRRGLERAYRALARQATTVERRIALVDRANEVRPTTLL